MDEFELDRTLAELGIDLTAAEEWNRQLKTATWESLSAEEQETCRLLVMTCGAFALESMSRDIVEHLLESSLKLDKPKPW